MSGRALGKPRDAGDEGGLEACAGKLRSKGLCWQSAEQALVLAICGAKPGLLSRAFSRSLIEPLQHGFRGCRPYAFVRGDQQVAPGVSLSC